MREILFRGKRTDNGEWVYGGYFDGIKFPIIAQKVRETESVDVYTAIGTQVVRETIGQYTGYTDKNGTKIFDGDIVRYQHITRVIIYVTKWIAGCWHYEDVTGKTFLSPAPVFLIDGRIEVIGNIHDNPELLKG